jgi:hypothetical protein
VVASWPGLNPETAASPNAVRAVLDLIAEHQPTLVVLDSVGAAFGLEGINEDRDNEVGPWLERVPKVLAKAGPAVLPIDHSTKAGDNPLHPSGSKRNRAAVTGASYLAEVLIPFDKDNPGSIALICAKDRRDATERFDAGRTVTDRLRGRAHRNA